LPTGSKEGYGAVGGGLAPSMWEMSGKCSRRPVDFGYRPVYRPMHVGWLIGWCSTSLLAAYVGSASAHAILVRSSLADGPIPPHAATAVTLRFNSRIEVNLSRVVLLDGAHAERPLEVAPGTNAGEMVVQVPALGPGAYGLRYRVMAADGHLTDGTLRFSVAGRG